MPIRQPDGSRKPVDIRTLPFVRFDDNEAHSNLIWGVGIGEIKLIQSIISPEDYRTSIRIMIEGHYVRRNLPLKDIIYPEVLKCVGHLWNGTSKRI